MEFLFNCKKGIYQNNSKYSLLFGIKHQRGQTWSLHRHRESHKKLCRDHLQILFGQEGSIHFKPQNLSSTKAWLLQIIFLVFTCPVFFVSNTLNRLSITISALHLHKHKLKSVHCDFGFYFGKSWVTNSFSWILLIVSSGKSILKEFHRVITSSSVNWCCWKKKDKSTFSFRHNQRHLLLLRLFNLFLLLLFLLLISIFFWLVQSNRRYEIPEK